MNRESQIAEKVMSRVAGNKSLIQLANEAHEIWLEVEDDGGEIEQEVGEGRLQPGVLNYRNAALKAGQNFEKALRQYHVAIQHGGL